MCIYCPNWEKLNYHEYITTIQRNVIIVNELPNLRKTYENQSTEKNHYNKKNNFETDLDNH